MARQYDPWTNARHGYPRKDAPAFQREWTPLQSSGVLIANGTAVGAKQVIVKAPSSVGVSGTIYLWGISLAVADPNPQAGNILDDNDKIITVLMATESGPYFLHLNTPIKIDENCGLRFDPLLTLTANVFCTPYYVVMHKNYEAN